MKYFTILALLAFTIISCQNKEMLKDSIHNQYAEDHRKDHHSFSNPDQALTTNLFLDLNVDFTKKIITGVAHFDIVKSEGASEIIFDTKDLNISKVKLNQKIESKFTFGPKDDLLGQALHIPIEANTTLVSIYYETSANSAALQWLRPNQTADKKHPFLFSQGQAILTRTWIPCQDSPGIRITYDAKVKVPKELMAVMSASNPTVKSEDGVYNFQMKQAIPPYLIALAVGDLAFGSIGTQCGVYAEPSMLEASVYEFGDTEKMLKVAEDLYGPYLWERYDIIVLPPSFPFGGMENPRITFATPTIIAGDRSLTALIAHELAHSWSGNLVTNATWDDFWLNEGFTVYFERRIMEALYGKEYTDMLALLGFQDLEADVQHIGHNHADTHLKLNLKGRDADDGMTDIAYEKGAYFLMSLEEKVGREKFDDFLKTYFEEHKFKTLTTEEFVEYLEEKLIDKYNVETNYKDWIYGAGIPANCPIPKSDKFSSIDLLINRKLKNGYLEFKGSENWNTHQWLHFLRKIPKNTNQEMMKKLDEKFNFSNSGNAEILAAWFELSIKNGYYKNIKSPIEDFLVSVGRRKFLTPLYSAMKEADDLALARSIYQKKQNQIIMPYLFKPWMRY